MNMLILCRIMYINTNSLIYLHMRADLTVAVTQKTKEKLRGLKRYERETFDDIINRMIEQYQKGCVEEGEQKIIVKNKQ